MNPILHRTTWSPHGEQVISLVESISAFSMVEQIVLAERHLRARLVTGSWTKTKQCLAGFIQKSSWGNELQAVADKNRHMLQPLLKRKLSNIDCN